MCRLVKYMFLEAGAVPSDSYCQDEAPWAPTLLGPHCPLFARKFPETTAPQVSAPASVLFPGLTGCTLSCMGCHYS